MTVAAGLNRRTRNRLMREIGRHYRCCAAKKPERVHHHSFITLRHELGDPLEVRFPKNGDGVPIPGAMQLGVGRALAVPCLARIALRDSPKLQP